MISLRGIVTSICTSRRFGGDAVFIEMQMFVCGVTAHVTKLVLLRMRSLTPEFCWNFHRIEARRLKSDHKDAGQFRVRFGVVDLIVGVNIMVEMFWNVFISSN